MTYEYFYQTHSPPLKMSVWMGATSGGPAVFELSTEVAPGFSRVKDVPGFISVIALGNLLLVLAGVRARGHHDEVLVTRTEPSILQRVWPRRARSILWGPPVVIDGNDLSNAAQLIAP